jgi:cephalosporin hydroxylase
MADAKRDGNREPTIMGVSSIDGETPVNLAANPVTGALKAEISGAGSGGTSSVDRDTFSAGTTAGTPTMAVYQATPTNVADGEIGVPRMTIDRKLIVDATLDSTGLATESKQDDIITAIEGISAGSGIAAFADSGNTDRKGLVDGDRHVQVDVLTAPTTTVTATDLDIRNLTNTDVVTAELSAVDNAVLDQIEANQDSQTAILTTIDADTSDIHTNTDAMVTDLAAIETLLTTIEGNQLADGHNVTIDNATPIDINISSSDVSLGGGAEYELGEQPADPKGKLMAWYDTDNSEIAHVSQLQPLPVSATLDATGLATADKQDDITNAIGDLSSEVQNVVQDLTFTDTMGQVDSSPTANTVLGRLKDISDAVDSIDNVLTAGSVDVNIQNVTATIDTTPVVRVAVFDDNDTQITSFGGGSGSAAFADSGNTDRKGLVDGDRHVQVDVLSAPTTTVTATDLDIRNLTNTDVVTAELASGSNTIGAVNLAQYTPASGRLPVDGSGVTQPVSGTITANQGGTWNVGLSTGSNVIGSLTANQSVNIAQMNGVSTTMGNGTSGTGVQRVTIASDSTGQIIARGGAAIDAAMSGNPVVIAGRASTATPTAMSADNDVQALWLTRNGALNIADAGGAITVDGTVTAELSATDNAVLDQIETNQDTQTAILTTIDADTGAMATDLAAIETLLTQIDTDTGNIATAVQLIDNAISGTEMQVDLVAPIPAGTNTIGNTGAVAHTGGGYTPGKLISAASTNATSVKGSAGKIGYLTASNINAAARYLKIYNKASAPTVGTDTPVHTFLIPGGTTGAGTNIPLPSEGIALGTGIAFALTTGAADADTGAVASAEVIVNYGWI